VDATALARHVELVEYWSIACPPCLASIPALSAVQARHPDRLRVIASQWGEAEPAQVAAVWHAHQGSDAVSVLDYAALPGSDISALPWAVVFDASGRRRGEGDTTAMIAEADALAGAAGPTSPRP
jgi:thiol-disulfide isomerase/thioredoxin